MVRKATAGKAAEQAFEEIAGQAIGFGGGGGRSSAP